MERPSHPCLGSGCRHPESEHVATPELAGPEEVVVWCFACRRHETRGSRRWFQHRARSSSAKPRGYSPRTY
ncbi:MAG TPA: hypothetical protein VJ021_02900 [Thermoplasmata archaeon]|nr:hypothetical protein [Thermoplasmata archaeon]